jgi:hypothetical protein
MSIPPDEVLPSSGPSTVADGPVEADSTDVDDAVEDYLGAVSDAPVEPEPTATTSSVDAPAPAPGSTTAAGASPVPDGGDDRPGGSGPAPAEASAAPAAEGHYVDLTAPSGSLDHEADSSWGPGSWSQLEADLDVDAAASRPAEVVGASAATSSVRAANGPATGSTATVRPQADAGAARPSGPEVIADEDEYVDDRPTQAVDRAEAPRDRFMQELDDAVNDTGTVSTTDDAMTAFFEGTSESKTRRFGWRR